MTTSPVLTCAEAALAHLSPTRASRAAAPTSTAAPRPPEAVAPGLSQSPTRALPPAEPAVAETTTSTAAEAGEPPPPARSASTPPHDPERTPREADTAPVRVRLVPHVVAGRRPRAGTGPGPVRPPTLEERALERRRAVPRTSRDRPLERPAPTDATLPEPTSVCCSIVLVALEAMTGTRSISQLARWVTPELYEQLAARAAVTTRAVGAVGAARSTARPEVRRARVCRLGQRAAEATIVVQDGARVRAVAIRLEERRGAWRAVALEIG
ncbi:Rv3235 family protein [Cellulomonas chengniuliangii]|uniref:Rv3235 family protein n=1 Tax=Cellulomonas chengniuliangii TaxID=2968084 RepID=UPI001D0F3C24|nr:Rv3235 family protein [Cellulomonas chengniuliangii]MCC2316889.1 Rv3235 family protein [Cellulomonas chengniuliangii]